MSIANLTAWPVGSLVRVRQRDWVVLPSEDEDVLRLRPLSGSEVETCGVYLGLERPQPAQFPLPDPETAGDFVAGRLLRDAARLSLRSGAGPFRSLGRISVRPRPYQFVPLIMALRLDPVRMLIADDVGVGKTIEAGVIARELLDRGEALRLAVICPPHLCDQWHRELRQKFHIDAVVVRTSTMGRLERDLPRPDLSVWRYYPHLIVSIDFAKSDRWRPWMLQNCPDLVIVDEAHQASPPGNASGADHQRHDLVRAVAADANRHLILLTATPHSGIESSFLSLIGLLDPKFATLNTETLSERDRAALARHFVQRRRADVERWMDAETPFPSRKSSEETYELTGDYRKLFDEVLKFTRETVRQPGLSAPRRRVRYWAALSLLRSLMSSPAAAVQAFENRIDDSAPAVADPLELDDDTFRHREVLDPLAETGLVDTVPEAAVEAGEADLEPADRRRLRQYQRRAEALAGDADPKLRKLTELVQALLEKSFNPIVFCRFIPTAKYVAEELGRRLGRRFDDLNVVAVSSETGNDEEREERIAELAGSRRRVLVATDCLSEGIDLQQHFDAVVHYDLPWNPNRLEQREGRVDRYGQPKREVHAALLYGSDNPIDGIVLRVLLRKAREIHRRLGISVPVPNSESVVQTVIAAMFESPQEPQQLALGFADVEIARILEQQMERAAEREHVSRSRFAQHGIKPDEVARELEAADEVLGDPGAVRRFLLNAAQRLDGLRIEERNGYWMVDASGLDGVQARLRWKKPQRVVFDTPRQGLQVDEVLGRNHLLVSILSERIMSEAFRASPDRRFARCGAATSRAVETRSVLALLRLRYRLTHRKGTEQFAEEVVTVGFRRRANGDGLEILAANGAEVLKLLEAAPAANISREERVHQVEWACKLMSGAVVELKGIARERAAELEQAHSRLRQVVGGGQIKVHPYDPDTLGLYVLVPSGGKE